MRATQGNGGMLAALGMTAAHPEWWAMALASFLLRGGLLVIALPIIPTPTTASLTNLLSPSVESLVLVGPTVEGVVVGTLALAVIGALLLTAALAGSWLDLALLRETTSDPELDLTLRSSGSSAADALGIRLVAHVPTLGALAFAAIRLVDATYAELLSPGSTVPIAIRVLSRAPEAAVLVVATWLAGETIGGLAARRHAAGETVGRAIKGSLRQVASVRGGGTLLVTNAVLLAVAVPFLAATGRAWEHMRAYLLEGATSASLSAALLLFVTTWLLGLAVLGVALAWRATAWTMLVATEHLPGSEPSSAPAPEVAAG